MVYVGLGLATYGVVDIMELHKRYKNLNEFPKKFVDNLPILKQKNKKLVKEVINELTKNKDKLIKVVKMIGLPVERINVKDDELRELFLDPYDLLIAIVYDKFKDKLNEFNITSKENVLKMKKLVDDLVWIYDNYVKEVYDEYYYMFFYDIIEGLPQYQVYVWINLSYLIKLLVNLYLKDKKLGFKLRNKRYIVLYFIKGLLELDKLSIQTFLKIAKALKLGSGRGYLYPVPFIIRYV